MAAVGNPLRTVNGAPLCNVKNELIRCARRISPTFAAVPDVENHLARQLVESRGKMLGHSHSSPPRRGKAAPA